MTTPAQQIEHARTRKRFLSSVAGIFVASLVATALVFPASSAAAEEIPGAITSVSFEKESFGYNERIRLNFDWAVPNTAVAGDTFSLSLPAELKADNRAKFRMFSPEGDVVALSEWHGTTVIFTLTDYVEHNDNVAGSGFVAVRWEHSNVPETSAPITMVIEGKVVVIEIGDKPTPAAPCWPARR